MARRNLTREISKTLAISERRSNVVLGKIVEILIEHVRKSQGDGIIINGFGEFRFALLERFGTFSVTGGRAKNEDDPNDDVLASYVRTLVFSPHKSLSRNLETEGEIFFRPVKEFRSRTVIGYLRRGRAD